ncbi:MAG: NYN domain-containing protein [Candidatus Hodarchaeales archaeon]
MVKNSVNFETHSFPSKAAVVVDGGYWRKIIEEIGISSVDLVSLTDFICLPAFRIRTYFFDGKTQKSQSFHDGLQLLDRFEVSLGEVVPRPFSCPSCQETVQILAQKRVDVALAVELVHLATSRQIDLIVLIAGDRDFIPAIETAKHAGVILRLIHGHPKTVSDTLFKLVDEKVELSVDFFKQNKINYRRKKTIRKQQKGKQDKETLKLETDIETITTKIESILVDLISKTSKEYIPLSRIGIELNRIEPKWREKAKTKHLKDLIGMAEKKFKIKVQKKHYYISTTKKVSTGKKGKTKEPASLDKFLINTITDYFTDNQTKSLSIIQLGSLLHKKNPNWKKKYEVKQLNTALESLGDNLILSGERNSLRIKLP